MSQQCFLLSGSPLKIKEIHMKRGAIPSMGLENLKIASQKGHGKRRLLKSIAIEAAALTGTDRIELYTESYAKLFAEGHKQAAIKPFIKAANKAKEYNLGINAGHDLDFQNLLYFTQNIPGLLEVSIGHALICDAINWGLENTVQLYKRQCGGILTPNN